MVKIEDDIKEEIIIKTDVSKDNEQMSDAFVGLMDLLKDNLKDPDTLGEKLSFLFNNKSNTSKVTITNDSAHRKQIVKLCNSIRDVLLRTPALVVDFSSAEANVGATLIELINILWRQKKELNLSKGTINRIKKGLEQALSGKNDKFSVSNIKQVIGYLEQIKMLIEG